MPSVNGLRLLSCKIRMPRVGAWHTDFELDVSDEENLDALAADDDGKVRFTLEHEGVSFSGTYVRGAQKRAVYQARMVGGRGGLSSTLPARSYTSGAGVKVSQVVGDILREAGESLSSTVEESVLARKVPRWTRAECVASHALLKIADAIGCTWRVLRDGTIWIGEASYPEAEVEHMTLDEDWSDGSILVATNEAGGAGPLLLEPGTTFHGQRLEMVEHVLSGSGFRTVAKNTTLGNALDKFLAGIRQEIDYSRAYPAKVDRMNADGTVAVTPDNPKLKGQGLDKVSIYTGSPGAVTVPSGTRCLLEFENGDPSSPFVSRFKGNSLTELRLGSGAALAARADRTDARIAAVENKVNSMVTAINSHVHTGVTTGAGSSGPPAVPQSAMSSGSSTAADKTRVE